MAVFYFETILKVKLLGMQVTTVKINFTEDMDRNNISLGTYDFLFVVKILIMFGVRYLL